MAAVTDHSTLLSLLGEWVTVTHPDAPHRLWHGKLRDVMHAPCIVVDLPEGGTQVFPQVFDVAAAAPAPGGPHPDTDTPANPFAALRDTGLLWLINRVASNGEGEPWMFDPATDNDGYQRAEKTIADAAGRGDDGGRCCVCGGRPVVYENYKDQPFCAGCANCSCGQDVCVRTRPDERPDADVQRSGRTRPPILGTSVTSTDAVRTPDPDAASRRPDAPDWKVCGDRRCIDPRCREEATLAEARERLANAMQLPLDLIAPVRCDCGQTGPLVGEAANGHHFHISAQEYEQLVRGADEGLPGIAWGKCWDRAEALRADLERAVAAYDALRARVVTTSKYVEQQRAAGFPLRGGDNRHRILETLAIWTDDPGPLTLANLTHSEAP
ncbi:hypothetical protein [Streptomyces afghaniensis]|uniref:hypothetical protein n=1 Tax=Streptomyces afghaniensis TaxID=66865 RepID=UPI00277D452D|nr:hypothetical protein [Streptomyces afghaniensis]MDQ1018827.1 hypothetical protein [Streptomyces afghaniensis]